MILICSIFPRFTPHRVTPYTIQSILCMCCLVLVWDRSMNISIHDVNSRVAGRGGGGGGVTTHDAYYKIRSRRPNFLYDWFESCRISWHIDLEYDPRFPSDGAEKMVDLWSLVTLTARYPVISQNIWQTLQVPHLKLIIISRSPPRLPAPRTHPNH